MQAIKLVISDPLGATRVEITDIKDGQTKRRERRAKERKAKKY